MSNYDAKSCNADEKAYYTLIEAAIRWCNLTSQEAFILQQMEGAAIPTARDFPRWPCLRANAEKIHDAIENEGLPHGRDGKTVEKGNHVAPPRRTVRHSDLKKWMAEHYPDQKPKFLFDEIERSTHQSFNIESFQALQADLEATKKALESKTEQYKNLKNDYNAQEGELLSLRKMAETYSSTPSTSEKNSLYKLVLGMAMEGYRYNPTASRNDCIGEICDDLAKHELTLSDDTIRKWLNEAKEILP